MRCDSPSSVLLHPQASKVAPRDPDVKKKLAECEKEVKRQRFEEALSLPVRGMQGHAQYATCCGPGAVLRRDHDRGWEGAWQLNRPGRQVALRFTACSEGLKARTLCQISPVSYQTLHISASSHPDPHLLLIG